MASVMSVDLYHYLPPTPTAYPHKSLSTKYPSATQKTRNTILQSLHFNKLDLNTILQHNLFILYYQFYLYYLDIFV